MRFARFRSGLAETSHDVAGIALDSAGSVVFASGDVATPLYYRSAIKPFQALAAARAGLRLPDEHLAVTCASHGGYPVHLAIVEQILNDHGLTTDDLQCPPDFPLSPGAGRLQSATGHSTKTRIFHNCSGKHAGWLAACTVSGWDTSTYLDPDHPLQRSIRTIVGELTGVDPLPTGVDGCGAPTLRGTIEGLARAFLRLGDDPELLPIATAMRRFGALVSDNVRGSGRIGVTLTGPSKVGAEGLFALCGPGVAIAVKSADGDETLACAAALEIADRLGILTDADLQWLDGVRRPPQLGAGRPVGTLELVAV
jgi:L-asparaginase II